MLNAATHSCCTRWAVTRPSEAMALSWHFRRSCHEHPLLHSAGQHTAYRIIMINRTPPGGSVAHGAMKDPLYQRQTTITTRRCNLVLASTVHRTHPHGPTVSILLSRPALPSLHCTAPRPANCDHRLPLRSCKRTHALIHQQHQQMQWPSATAATTMPPTQARRPSPPSPPLHSRAAEQQQQHASRGVGGGGARSGQHRTARSSKP